MIKLSGYHSSEKHLTINRVHTRVLLLAVTVFFSPTLVYAAADSDDTPAEPSSVISPGDIDELRDLIDADRADKAIDRLQWFARKDDENADVWNLLGYAYRKQEQYDESGEAYSKALSLDPQHKGALEYQGELFLALGDTKAAQINLKKLQSLCPAGCHELDDLQEALDSYK